MESEMAMDLRIDEKDEERESEAQPAVWVKLHANWYFQLDLLKLLRKVSMCNLKVIPIHFPELEIDPKIVILLQS